MTDPRSNSKIVPAYRVSNRVRAHRTGTATPGGISSIHSTDNRVEYVVLAGAVDGGTGQVLTIWTTSGQSCFLTFASVSGESR